MSYDAMILTSKCSCLCIHLTLLDCGYGAQTYCVRLITYLPGKTLAESPGTMQDLYHVGRLIAFMDKALQKVRGKVKLVSFHIFLIHMQLF